MTGKSAWYFYKVKWGAQEEFLALFRKNHYPVLEAQFGGRISASLPSVRPGFRRGRGRTRSTVGGPAFAR